MGRGVMPRPVFVIRETRIFNQILIVSTFIPRIFWYSTDRAYRVDADEVAGKKAGDDTVDCGL